MSRRRRVERPATRALAQGNGQIIAREHLEDAVCDQAKTCEQGRARRPISSLAPGILGMDRTPAYPL